jgi:pimeloyl-ACP methyl ester carboxylesterase
MRTTILSILLSFTLLDIQAQEQQHVTTGYAPVNGLDMYYEIHGEGEPLVLIHGSFMTIDMNYGQLIPELAKSNQVIAVELQGHGHTKNIDRPFSFENFAQDVAALLDHLGIPKANLAGYSLGATVALQTAILFPEKVGKIVFISSVSKNDGWIPAAREAIAGIQPEYITASPLKSAYDAVAPDKSQWNHFVSGMITFEHKPFDLGLENIKQLKAPICIINGDYDGVDLSHSKEIFEAAGGGGFGVMEPLSPSRLAIIPGTTHVTVMMQTDQILEVIAPFLSH